MHLRSGLRPEPRWGAYSAPADPVVGEEGARCLSPRTLSPLSAFGPQECTPKTARLSCYRAMQVVLARYSYRKSFIHLSVCPSVTLWYRERIHWVSSKVSTRIISLVSCSSEPQHRQSSPSGTSPKFGWDRGGVLFSAENLQYLWNGAR